MEAEHYTPGCWLHKLTPREERIVRYLYGVDGKPQSLGAVAEHFAVSKERVRQIAIVALGKLARMTGGDAALVAWAAQPGFARYTTAGPVEE